MLKNSSVKIFVMGFGLVNTAGASRLWMGILTHYKLVIPVGKAISASLLSEIRSFPDESALGGARMPDWSVEVANFRLQEYKEDMLMRWLHRAVGVMEGFSLIFNNYGGQPPHTIYLRVQNPERMAELVSRLGLVARYLSDQGGSPMDFAVPRLPLLPHISPSRYDELMVHFAGRLWHEVLPVERLELYRSADAGICWQRVSVIGLRPADIKQEY